MHKIDNGTKQYYLENPEFLAQRKFIDLEVLEDLIERHKLEKHTKEIAETFNRMWDVAESYWVFPELDDYKKIIDITYKKYGIY